MTTATTFFSRLAALATSAALSFVLISGTVATPAATASTVTSNVSELA